MTADLPLIGRTGLPDQIAYLRETYPEPTWRTHANYGEMAAFWLQIHDSLREHARVLAQDTRAMQDGGLDPAGFQRAFVPRYNHFIQHLTGHHQI